MSTVAHAPATAELPDSPSRGRRIWRWVAASSAVAAGGLHIAAAAQHVGTHDLVVGFFLLVAFVQLGLGAWIVVSSWAGTQPDVRLVALALMGTVALVGLYVVAHTTDLLAAFQVHDAAGGHGGATGAPQGHATETVGPVALGLEPVVAREPVTAAGDGDSGGGDGDRPGPHRPAARPVEERRGQRAAPPRRRDLGALAGRRARMTRPPSTIGPVPPA